MRLRANSDHRQEALTPGSPPGPPCAFAASPERFSSQAPTEARLLHIRLRQFERKPSRPPLAPRYRQLAVEPECPSSNITRRLAAILAADVVGYSRMMGADEAGTSPRCGKIWSETFNPAVAARHGRIVKMMGDGALVEFGSVVDAVECAVAVQRAMAERNRAAERPVAFRIGINLGDIVIEGDDIFGDGVNVAARLESQAPQGGILVSDVVHAQVNGKVGVTFADAGEIKLKNIERPLRVVALGRRRSAARAAGARGSSPRRRRPTSRRSPCCRSPS